MEKHSFSKKPLMLAYIIFLFACFIWNIVCQITEIEFPTWNKIVVGVTMASYFFSLNSLNKLSLKQQEYSKSLFWDEIAIIDRLRKKLTSDKDASILEGIEEIRKEDLKMIEDTLSSMRRYDKRIFMIDVLGYLTFFVVLGIDGASKLLLSSIDSISLIAFATVLVVDYMEETRISVFARYCKDKKAEFQTKIDELNELLENRVITDKQE